MSRALPMIPTALALALALAPSPARAQDGWAVIVATTRPADVARATETAEHSAAALEASVGGVLAGERAIARIEAGLSEPFRAAPPELARRVAQASESVLEDVAFGRNRAALDVGQPVLAELDAHAAAIARDDEGAADVANLCLYLVRAHVQERDAAAAREQVERCLRLVPDLAADARLHPPQVRELVAAARAELEEGRGGILAIHAAPTDPEGCAIRVSGRRVGQTPWARVPLVPGTYAVQIECDAARAGRVHRAEVAAGAPARITIRARLADALSTDGAIALAYADAGELAARLADDVAAIAEVLAVPRMLVAVDDGRALVVRAFAVGAEGTRVLGSAPVPEPIDGAHSREAVAAALAGGARAGTSEGGIEAPPPVSTSPDVGGIVAGTLLAAGGLASLGIGWYLWSELEVRHAEYAGFGGTITMEDRYFPVKEELEQLAWGMVGTSIGGGVLLTASLPFLLPQTEEWPWWSAVIGAGGAALVIVGAWQVTETRPIGPAGFQRPNDHDVLGGHLIAHGVPLLSVPLIYAIRALTGSASAGASVRVDGERAELRVWGTF